MENNINNVSEKPKRQSEIGPVAGSIIVILVVIAGGVYFWGNKIVKNNQTAEVENQAMSASGYIDFIENSINTKELDDQDKELNKLDQEIQNL